MSTNNGRKATYRVSSRRTDHQWEGEIVAYWEASLDPISDDYTPDEIDAADLFDKWAERVQAEYPNGLVPIHWFVVCHGQGKLEYMPFQFDHSPGVPHEDFLTFYTWPANSATGEPLNWLTLPVEDKLWKGSRGDKGGFIQQATGWKPSVLQPHVYLPALIRRRG